MPKGIYKTTRHTYFQYNHTIKHRDDIFLLISQASSFMGPRTIFDSRRKLFMRGQATAPMLSAASARGRNSKSKSLATVNRTITYIFSCIAKFHLIVASTIATKKLEPVPCLYRRPKFSVFPASHHWAVQSRCILHPFIPYGCQYFSWV